MRRSLRIAGHWLHYDADEHADAAMWPALQYHHSGPDREHATPWRLRMGGPPPAGWNVGAPALTRVGGRGIVVSGDDPPELQTYFKGAGIEHWMSEQVASAGDRRSHPSLPAVSALLAERGVSLLHAGAIEFHGVGALLLGPAGAGKSTTALMCARGGLGFLGDDMVLLDGAHTLHHLSASVKLNDDSRRNLDPSGWTSLGPTPVGKTVYVVGDPVTVVGQARLGALFVMRPPARTGSRVEPISAAVATRHLTMAGRMSPRGPEWYREWLATSAAIAAEVPAFELAVSWESDAVVDAVRTVLAARSDPAA